MKNWKTIFIIGMLCMVVGVGTGLYLSGRKAPDISLISTAEAAGGTVTKTDGTAPDRCVYYPGTEALGKDEIRLIALGTGMPLARRSQAATCWLVEVGNGDKFLFDIGTGANANLSALMIPFDFLRKVFLTHLHTDHWGDLPGLWAGGWTAGRTGPLEIWGPSGAREDMGTKYALEHFLKAYNWDNMQEKKEESSQANDHETSRRTFLKAGAATVGTTLLGALLAQAQEKEEQVQLMFVQNARDVVMGKGRLTLIGVSPTTLFFTDRPKRIVDHMATADFVFEWQEGTGKESFHADPPNAALSIFAKDEIVDVVVVLKNPRLAGGALIYDIDVLEQDQPIPSGPVSMFIDPLGRPLSPTAVAGVHRRHRRRRVHRHRVIH